MLKPKTKPNFESEITNVCNLLDTIRVNIPEYLNALKRKLSLNRKDFEKLEKKGYIKKISKGYEVRIEFASKFEKNRDDLNQLASATKLLPISQYILLFTVFESYLKNLIKVTLLENPQLLSKTEKKISLNDILEIKNIDGMLSYAIESEIETVTSRKYSIIDWINKSLSIDIRENKFIKDRFLIHNEIRNSFVHNNGVVGPQYIQCLNRNGVDKVKLPKIGEKIQITPELFSSTANNLYLYSLLIGLNIWQNQKPKQISKIEGFIINQQVQNLNKQKYITSELISDIALSFGKFSSQENETIILINKAMSLKYQRKNDDFKKIMSKLKPKSGQHQVKLAVALLNDNFKEASIIMRKIPKRELQVCYEEWPLFKINKRSKLISLAYKEIVGKNALYNEDPNQNVENSLLEEKINSSKNKEDIS